MRFPSAPRVVISGAGSGLGRALALEFARRSARVLVLDINDTAAEETARRVRELGGEAASCHCDVGDVDDWRKAEKQAQALFGGVDVLVNNAGVAAAGNVGDMPIEDWRWLLRTNLDGVINGCHVFLPVMRAAGGGYVLNVASSGGIASLPQMAAYNVSKAGVIALSETLHAEAGAYGVRVSVLCPTFFQTNLMQSFRGTAADRQTADNVFARTRVTAQTVARSAVRGLEAGHLMIIPQLDGLMIWRLKRLMPATYHRLVGFVHGSGVIQRWLKS